MINCTIIGSGQIGSRHLQALHRLEGPTRIDLVDPSDESLQIARSRYAEVLSPGKQNIELFSHNDLDNLPNNLDLVIVATNSTVREKVIRDLVKKCSVKNLLLEKILFQKSAHYTEVDSLLKEKSIPTWVSCWMRTTDLYKQIKSALNLEHPIQMKVEGAQWGVGTSGVHFMDLLSYLSDCIDFKFIESNLEDKLFEAKRAGYKEFLGHLTGHNSRGDSLDLICKKDLDGEPLEIKIQNGLDSYQVRMSITTTDVDFKSSNGLAGRIGKASFPYQSEMTHLWVNDILSKGYCDLPTYSQSMVLHLELIRVLTEHMEKITGEKIDACPIT